MMNIPCLPAGRHGMFIGMFIGYNKNMKNNIRKIVKNGRESYYVNIPKELIKKFGWKERQKVVVTYKGRKRLEIKDWKKN